MYRARGFRVVLTRTQAAKLSGLVGGQRETYNWAVSRLKEDPTLTWYDLQKEFTALRRATPHLQRTERAFQNAAVHRARTAADLSNRYGGGNLKYRTRKNSLGTVECEGAPTFVDNRSLSLPGLGRVILAEEQPYAWPDNWLYGARSFRLVDVSPRKDASVWRLYVTYKMPGSGPRSGGLAVGIDRGITNPTVVAKSDGSVACYDTASKFRSNQHWNDRMRRRMAKANKRSRNYREMGRERARRNRKNAAERDYCEWLLAKEVCEGASVVCLEDLKIEAMTRRGTGKRGLNRGMRFVRHSEVLRKIGVVAERLGIRVVRVNPAGTSVTCARCGHADGESRRGERFECVECRHLAHADGNAAINILCRGTNQRVPAGEGMFLGRRESP